MNSRPPQVIPARLSRLPRTPAGLPIPWFVAWEGARYDFRVVDARKIRPAVQHRLCWLCGQQMGRMMCFVVGPDVRREPGEQRAADASGLRRIRPARLPIPDPAQPGAARPRWPDAGGSAHAGTAILRNPGVSALYVTRSFTVATVPGGILFDMGAPEEVAWWSQGRAATRAEVEHSIATGLPILEAEADRDGVAAHQALAGAVVQAMRLLPAGEAP